MVLERPDIINRFIHYYQGIGASHLALYHDGPVPDGLTTGDGITHTAMDAAFWANQESARPADHILRQLIAYEESVRTDASEWSLIVDIDEFLTSPIPISQILQRLGPDEDALRIRNVEAVWGPGDALGTTFTCSYMRTAGPPGRTRRLMRFLHGQHGALLRKGVTGHSLGKHFVRNGAPELAVEIHHSERDGKIAGQWLHEAFPDLQDVLIAHFDAIDIDHWTEKWSRRRGTPWEERNLEGARHSVLAAAIREAISADDNGQAARSLFATLYGATRWQALWLRLFGRLKRARIFADPETGAPYRGN